MEIGLREQIAQILEINPQGDWVVIDQLPSANLYMVRHTDDGDLEKYGWLQGVVVDVKEKKVVACPYGYMPFIHMDEIQPTNTGEIIGTDDSGNFHQFKLDEVTMKRGYEGCTVTVFKHQGKVYVSGRKKFDLNKSAWGDNPSFLQMYKSLGGPTEELFDKDCETSCYSHNFLIVHPLLLMQTQLNVGGGFLLYLGHVKNFENDKETVTKVNCVDKLPTTITTPFILDSIKLNIEEANHHLRFGFGEKYDDGKVNYRRKPGEFVVLESNGQLYALASSGYLQRKKIRGDHPNIYYRFFQLYDHIFEREEFKFKKYFELLNEPLPGESGKSAKWPEGDCVYPATRADKLLVIWRNLLASCPPQEQAYVASFMNKIVEDRRKVVDYLLNFKSFDPNVPKQVPFLINQAKQRNYQNKKKDGMKDAMHEVVHEAKGADLYKIITFIRKNK
jgi:hypothetical protein